MSSLVQQLFDIKQEIEDTEKEVAVIEGRLTELLSTLKNEWGCETVDDAKAELLKYDEYIGKLNREMGEIVEKLEGLGWDML